MDVRPFRDSDLDAVVELFTASVHHLAARHYDEAQRAAWAPVPPDRGAWRNRLGALQTLVAEQGGTLAGFVSYRPNGYIDLLYVSPDAPRRGVATALYHEAESALVSAGIKELTVDASLVAHAFFEHQGFLVEEMQTVTRGGVSFQRYAMRKAVP